MDKRIVRDSVLHGTERHHRKDCWHTYCHLNDQTHSIKIIFMIKSRCIGDDTKAAALKTKKNKIRRRTIFNMADRILTPCNVAQSWHWFRQVSAPCNVACGSGIVTVNSPSGSTLQCDTWLWDDMPLNSPKRPPYWNSTSGFNFDHVIAVDMLFCSNLRSFIQFGPPSTERKWRHVDFPDGGPHPSWILGIQ